MKATHILIVDHDSVRREQLADALRVAGHLPVLEAESNSAAQALDVPGLDLVLLDLTHPGLDPAALRRLLAPDEPARPDPLEAAERRHIAAALEYTHGNRRRTAHLLGIARSTLLAKVRKYGLDAAPGTAP
ncbi:MAG: helix-turn-helix domain-containing protein [Gemmatimonadota bacterium]